MDDYETRAKAFDFASPDAITSALSADGTIVLDVRSAPEIEASGKIQGSINTSCTRDDCQELRTNPEAFVPSKDATVVIYCGSGRRAMTAREILRSKGHTGPILNAGGYQDILRVVGK